MIEDGQVIFHPPFSILHLPSSIFSSQDRFSADPLYSSLSRYMLAYLRCGENLRDAGGFHEENDAPIPSGRVRGSFINFEHPRSSRKGDQGDQKRLDG